MAMVSREINAAAPTPPPPTADQTRAELPLKPGAPVPSMESAGGASAQAGRRLEVATDWLAGRQLGQRQPVRDTRGACRLRQCGRRSESRRQDAPADVPAERRNGEQRSPVTDAPRADPANPGRQIDSTSGRSGRHRLGLQASFDHAGNRSRLGFGQLDSGSRRRPGRRRGSRGRRRDGSARNGPWSRRKRSGRRARSRERAPAAPPPRPRPASP